MTDRGVRATKYFSQDPRGVGVIHFQPLNNNNALSPGKEVLGFLWRGGGKEGMGLVGIETGWSPLMHGPQLSPPHR